MPKKNFDHAAFIPAGLGDIEVTILHPVEKTKVIRTDVHHLANKATLQAVVMFVESCPVKSRVLVLTNLSFISNCFNGKWKPKRHIGIWDRLSKVSRHRTVTIQFCKNVADQQADVNHAKPGAGEEPPEEKRCGQLHCPVSQSNRREKPRKRAVHESPVTEFDQLAIQHMRSIRGETAK